MSLDAIATTALTILGLAGFLSLVAFGGVSLREREPRAAVIAFGLALASLLPVPAAHALPSPFGVGLLGGLLGLLLGAILLGFLPIGTRLQPNGSPIRRVDERDIMFARARLKPGSVQFEAYYAMRPENRESDDRTRALPGLLSLQAQKADPEFFAAAQASFELTSAMRNEVDGPVTPVRSEKSPAEMTARLKELALESGACDVGITRLRPHHVYTHVGRGTGVWGERIELDHRWAIAFTVEMDYHAMRCAPAAPVVAESARQYAISGKIAVEMATVCRSLGYPARAHIDGNYRVIAPLVARDAGLGELGRMGILMTPRLGPRVRLGVVTTDLPLLPDPPGDDPSVLNFCTVCRKCATNCPSGSISFDDREPMDEGLRWAIDADGCFRYWNAIGTDCGVCMTVCPYSHPDNAAHNLVRWALRRSGAARRAALWMDDLFYGRRPRPCTTFPPT